MSECEREREREIEIEIEIEIVFLMPIQVDLGAGEFYSGAERIHIVKFDIKNKSY